MSLGQFTKELAKQAIGNPVKDAIDLLGRSDAPKDAAANAPAAPAPDNLAAIIMGQVQAMQAALKDDQELIVLCSAVGDMLRVFEIFAPSPKVLVMTGQDPERNTTRVIVPADAVQLVCKPMAVAAGTKATRVRCIVPKPKE